MERVGGKGMEGQSSYIATAVGQQSVSVAGSVGNG